ncbi:MAG: CBS domain-containing protein [Magnetococcales bacterium]|nr:CBS domain-containing protein [Magnetococcales bacterium]
METPQDIVKRARPFFLNYVAKLSNDLNTLTAAPVVCTLQEIELNRGRDDLELLFESDRSVAYVTEDGMNSGDIHLIFDIATSIALTGLMMMMGASVIQSQVKNREYNEEIQEGFQEVSNQVVGALNDLVEKKLSEGGHLFLVSTTHVTYGDFPNTFKESTTYLAVKVQIQVSDFQPQDAYWVLSRGFAETLLKVKIPGSDAELAEDTKKGGGEAAKPTPAAVEPPPPAPAPPPAPPPAPVPAAPAPAPAAKSAGAVKGQTGKNGQMGAAGKNADAVGKNGINATKGAKGLAGGGADEEGELAFLDPYQPGMDPGREVIDSSLEDPGTLRGGLAPGGKGSKASIAQGAMFSPLPSMQYAKDSMPTPNDAGSVATVITEYPFTLKEDERVIVAINAMRQDGYRYMGIERGGKLIRVISQSDLRQIMGPFFGTKAMNARDKALCNLPIGKINATQKVIAVTLTSSIGQAADLMMENRLHALPVVSAQGVLRGFVTLHGLLDFYRRKKQL